MRRILIVATVLLATCMSASAQGCKDAIKGVRDSWLTAWTHKQLDDVMKLYAEDATLLDADGHFHVRKDKIQDYFKTLISGTTVSVQSAGVTCSADTGYDTGTYTNSGGGMMIQGNVKIQGNVTMKGGGGTSHGNYVVVLRQDSGTWIIVQQASVRSEQARP